MHNKNEVVCLHEYGHTIIDISKKLGIHRNTAAKWIKRSTQQKKVMKIN